MRTKLTFALLLLCCGQLSAETLSFSERIKLAKEIEKQKSAENYFFKEMFPSVGGVMADAMKRCTSAPKANLSPFTLVADISTQGKFINIAYEPRINTAACFADLLSTLQAPPPPTCECVTMPIVIEMKIEP